MFVALTLSLLASVLPASPTGFTVTAERDYQVGELPVALTVTAVDNDGQLVPYFGTAALAGATAGDGAPIASLEFVAGVAKLPAVALGDAPIVITVPASDAGPAVESRWQPDLRRLPGWLSIMPPLIAILIAMLFRQALLALFSGVWVGALFVHGYDPFTALLRCFDTYLPNTLVDADHSAIVFATLAIGGMIGVIGKSGGTQALVDIISRWAKSRRSGMVTAWGSGLVLFFDDYANCLLVGNSVRPITDQLKISREKLSYIVDSTAAPLCTVALVSTWIGFQVSMLEDSLPNAGVGGYELFLSIIPYAFYSLLTILFVLAVAVTTRDFGPMARAERRAHHEGQLLSPNARPLMDRELTEMAPDDPSRAHASTAIVPILAIILFVVFGLYASGYQSLGDEAASAGLRDIIAAANSYSVLLWAAFGASIVAIAMAGWRRTVTVSQALDAWMSGAKAMTMALGVLVLAWALGDMCKNQLSTGLWVISQITPSPHFLPVLTFAISGVIALATGSSFSTMAIVIPIAGPMAWLLTGDASGIDPATVDSIRHATLGAVLSGAVFGDHCSPISDTTIMASMASAADHIDHVRTQLPYALLCALAASLFGFIPAGYGLSPYLSLVVAIVALVAVLVLFGRRVDHEPK